MVLLYVCRWHKPLFSPSWRLLGAAGVGGHSRQLLTCSPAQSTLSSPKAPVYLCPFLPLLVPTCSAVVVVVGYRKGERKEEALTDARGSAAPGLLPAGTLSLFEH